MTGEMVDQPVVSFFKPGLFPLLLTFGPFLYLYVNSITSERPEWKNIQLLHFLPFLLVVVHRSFTEPVSIDQETVNSGNPAIQANMIYITLVVISLITYWILSLIKVAKHRQRMQNVFSFQSSGITLNWLRFVVFIFLFIYILGFSIPVWQRVFGTNFLSNIDPLVLSFTFFAFAASLFGSLQPIIYTEEAKEEGPNIQNPDTMIRATKYVRSGLSQLETEKIKDQIIDHLNKVKPYLNPEYSINMLAEELHITRHHATQVINSNLNKNFYTLINELRVDEVIARINNHKYDNYTLLAIAYDSGFNSKSAFNRIFKQTTGKTPSQYKRTEVS